MNGKLKFGEVNETNEYLGGVLIRKTGFNNDNGKDVVIDR